MHPRRALALALCLTVPKPSSSAAPRAPSSRAAPAAESAPEPLRPAFESFSAKDLLDDIKTLASDPFEGRAPGSTGEALSVDYITQRFKALGLRPGGPDGTYVQKVPLVGVAGSATAAFAKAGRRLSLKFPEDYVAVSRRLVPKVEIKDSDVVFAGYGVVAPEYGWDDFKGVDVRGKTLLVLVNDPPVPDPQDPSKLDEAMFRGKAMTYYGRWTYKYELASAKGAAAAVIVHETRPAGYPWEVVENSWGRENFDIRVPDGNADRVAVEAWVSSAAASRLFALAGLDFQDMKKRAVSRDFRPVDLELRADFTVRNSLRDVASRNVLARIDGSDPLLRDEAVVYTAHWDHLGKDARLKGDPIYHGAVDNASGAAGLLELARAFSRLKTPPKRSVLFLSATAEEQGLLGSKYYAAHPVVGLDKTLAVINMDGLNVWGRAKDIVSVGLGNSTLDDDLLAAAREQGRVVMPDPEPEKGYFFRSDHFEFAKLGVPALDYGMGTDFIGKPAGWGKLKREEYTSRDYHKTTDTVRPDWDLSGAVDDLKLLCEAGWRVAQGSTRPQWKPGAEFKAKRETAQAATRQGGSSFRSP